MCAPYDLPSDYVFYLGSFDPRKNIETLLQIYVWCAETIGEQFPLVITGDPNTMTVAANGRKMTLGQMAQELNLDREEVRFIGRVAEEDKAALYANARCFVFTSLYEGFGLPVLEAMSCGTPVVGGNASSIPEVVGNAGMLVDPLDARHMAGAVIAICTEDDLHDRLSQRALLRASQFSWQRTALETLAVFNRVLAQKSAMGLVFGQWEGNVETFYATLASICFTLVGLWWVVVQFKYDLFMASPGGRLTAYTASMHFVAPGVISLVAVLTTDQVPVCALDRRQAVCLAL